MPDHDAAETLLKAVISTTYEQLQLRLLPRCRVPNPPWMGEIQFNWSPWHYFQKLGPAGIGLEVEDVVWRHWDQGMWLPVYQQLLEERYSRCRLRVASKIKPPDDGIGVRLAMGKSDHRYGVIATALLTSISRAVEWHAFKVMVDVEVKHVLGMLTWQYNDVLSAMGHRRASLRGDH